MNSTDFDPGGTIKPTARVTQVGANNNWDYNNGISLAFRIYRSNAEVEFPEYRDGIAFTRGMDAVEIIRDLRALANRLQIHCVDKIKEKL